MDNNVIGKYIEKKRKSKGLTQKELAKRLGLSNTAISKWECGCNLPDVSMLEPLSKELGVDVSKLVALQSGHVNYQSFDEIEEQEEIIPLSSSEESNLTKHKFHINKKNIIFLSIILLLFITTNIITAKISNSTKPEPAINNEVKVYEIISDDPSFNINGYMIYNNNEYKILLRKFISQNNLRGTNADPYIKNMTIYMSINEQVVLRYKTDMMSESKAELNEILENLSKNNVNEELFKIDINTLEEYFATSKIKIEYITDTNKKEEINVKIILKQVFI